MPVPKKHKTHSRTRTRRSHHAIKPAQFSVCSHCGSATMPHQVCSHCGYYRDKEVIKTLAKVEKKARKKLAKRRELERERGQQAQSGKEETPTLEELSKKQ